MFGAEETLPSKSAASPKQTPWLVTLCKVLIFLTCILFPVKCSLPCNLLVVIPLLLFFILYQTRAFHFIPSPKTLKGFVSSSLPLKHYWEPLNNRLSYIVWLEKQANSLMGNKCYSFLPSTELSHHQPTCNLWKYIRVLSRLSWEIRKARFKVGRFSKKYVNFYMPPYLRQSGRRNGYQQLKLPAWVTYICHTMPTALAAI